MLYFFCISMIATGCRTADKAFVDWSSIDITQEMYNIELSDLSAAMDMYAYAATEDIEEASQLTDEIVKQNFQLDSVAALKKYAVDEMVRHRVYEAVFEHIWDTATIDVLSSEAYKTYIEKVYQFNEASALQEGMDETEYIEETYHMTPEEYRQYEEARFAEYYLMKSILKQEGITISQSELDAAWSKLAEEEDITVEEAKAIFLEEDVEYIILSDYFYRFILDTYQVEIEQACQEMEKKLSLA